MEEEFADIPWEPFLPLLPQKRRAQCERLRQTEDRMRCVYGWLLVAYAYAALYAGHAMPPWRYAENGKPDFARSDSAPAPQSQLPSEPIRVSAARLTAFAQTLPRWDESSPERTEPIPAEPTGKAETAKPADTTIGGCAGFSLSHCDGAIAAAIHTCGAIGVDVEAVRPYRARTAQCFCTPAQLAELTAFSPEQADDLFTRLWTCKEASVKFTGAGIGAQLHMPALPARSFPIRTNTFSGWLSVCIGE